MRAVGLSPGTGKPDFLAFRRAWSATISDRLQSGLSSGDPRHAMDATVPARFLGMAACRRALRGISVHLRLNGFMHGLDDLAPHAGGGIRSP